MTEEDVLREIQKLVAAGEYLDFRLGVPGARLTGPGTFVGNQREYVRGSPEYLEVLAAGLIEKLPPLTPTKRETLEIVERDFGYPLPSLLRRPEGVRRARWDDGMAARHYSRGVWSGGRSHAGGRPTRNPVPHL